MPSAAGVMQDMTILPARVVLVLELLDRALAAGADRAAWPGASRSRAGRSPATRQASQQVLPAPRPRTACRRCRSSASAHLHGHRFSRDVPLEIVAEILQRALQRLHRARGQGAEGVARPRAAARACSRISRSSGSPLPSSMRLQRSARPTAAPRGRACTSRRTPGRRSAPGCAPCPPGRSGRRGRSSCPVPRRLPAFCSEAKSIGTSRCSASRKSVEAPPGSSAAEVVARRACRRRAPRGSRGCVVPIGSSQSAGPLHPAADAVELRAAVVGAAQALEPVRRRC